MHFNKNNKCISRTLFYVRIIPQFLPPAHKQPAEYAISRAFFSYNQQRTKHLKCIALVSEKRNITIKRVRSKTYNKFLVTIIRSFVERRTSNHFYLGMDERTVLSFQTRDRQSVRRPFGGQDSAREFDIVQFISVTAEKRDRISANGESYRISNEQRFISKKNALKLYSTRFSETVL